MIRNPVVAGHFYPAAPDELRQTVARLLGVHAEKDEAIGALCPHAGYMASGPVAGALYSRIAMKDTFVIIGPNHTGMGKPFSIMTEGVWRTPLGDVEIDSGLARQILGDSHDLEEDAAAHVQEHSIEVQLPFLQYLKPDVRFVPIVLAHAELAAYRAIGGDIARAIKGSGKGVVIVASGDMTHYETQASAHAKDLKAIEAILALDEAELAKRIHELNISACAYPPAATLIAASRELGANGAELIDYRTSGDILGDYSAVVGYAAIVLRKISVQAGLARETVESFVRERRVPSVKEPPAEMQEQAGAFVSIHKLGGLRGCIGTFQPTRASIAQEIVANAVASATRDPRFPPITPDELPFLSYKVDVLTSPEPVADKAELDAKKYGVIVRCGYRTGLLLPDLEGVETPDEQINICCQKGGIGLDEPLDLYRFEVKRYK